MVTGFDLDQFMSISYRRSNDKILGGLGLKLEGREKSWGGIPFINIYYVGPTTTLARVGSHVIMSLVALSTKGVVTAGTIRLQAQSTNHVVSKHGFQGNTDECKRSPLNLRGLVLAL